MRSLQENIVANVGFTVMFSVPPLSVAMNFFSSRAKGRRWRPPEILLIATVMQFRFHQIVCRSRVCGCVRVARLQGWRMVMFSVPPSVTTTTRSFEFNGSNDFSGMASRKILCDLQRRLRQLILLVGTLAAIVIMATVIGRLLCVLWWHCWNTTKILAAAISGRVCGASVLSSFSS